MPINPNIFTPDGSSVCFGYEFRWAKTDFKPHRGLSSKIHDQADAARKQISKEVEAFILKGRDSLPDPPPLEHKDAPDYVTGTVLVTVTTAIEGSGGYRHVAESAAQDAYKRTVSLLQTPLIEGYEPRSD